MNKTDILKNAEILINMHKRGELGGEVMPEDANPHLEKDSLKNYLYFTLPMALNYQRNSYTLWENALKTYNDNETKFVFDPKKCLNKSFEEVQRALTKYKVVLQKQKQTEIWLTLCKTIVELFNGDIRKLFDNLDNDVNKIRNFIQKEHKKNFPYLSGTKICNYWLYVIYEYTDRVYKNIEDLTVAPDTHVCKASLKLGLITEQEFLSNNVQNIVIEKWQSMFRNTKYKPIDIHKPLWLWSRNGFKELGENNMLEKIIETSTYVLDNKEYVKINEKVLKEFVNNLNLKQMSHWLAGNPFGLLDLELSEIINFLVLFGSIDYSFWGEPKWTVKYENKELDGAFALIYCLLKLREEKHHLDFEKITYPEFCKALKGNVDIPLQNERYNTLKEVSKIINKEMNGNFFEHIKNITTDIELFNVIIESFPNFKDVRYYKGQTIYFYKLAQLLTSDILNIRKIKERKDVDCSHLVGCADYKIPQVLRGLGIIEYNEELSNIVDNKQEILENSKYEIEIRASMIVAINMIKKELNNKITALEINDYIWSLGQDKTKISKPYHRTRTRSY